MIQYWCPVRDDQTNFTYSIDNVVVWFRLSYPEDSLCQEVLDFFSSHLTLDFMRFQSFKFACFREQFSVTLDDDASFWVGIGFNGSRGTLDPCIAVDFNPNKVCRFLDFVDLYNFILSRSKLVDIKRFDLAIDIPVRRADVFMYKGRRKLTIDSADDEELFFGNSWDNFTHYLGRRSSVGRVKLYNKSREAGLNYPLTRLELTLAPNSIISDYMPVVKYFDDLQMVFNDLKLSGSDRLILRRCIEHPDELGELSYYQRKRFNLILEHYTKSVVPDEGCYLAILSVLSRFTRLLDTGSYDYLSFLRSADKILVEDIDFEF